jgi:L-asparaginase
MNTKNILIINTGGTFNKIYNPISGELNIDTSSKSLLEIMKKWLCVFEVIEIIGKDSLDFNDNDRDLLLETARLNVCKYHKIIIIHGTDTMNISANFLAKAKLDLVIVFTGAMMPYSIDSTEATANLASAIGYATNINENGIYIAMNGNFGSYEHIKKDRQLGRFTS